MMNEIEKDWMPMYMMAYIRHKTLYLLSQNRLIAEAYANYVLEDLKDHIHSKRIKLNRKYQSVINLLINTARTVRLV